MRYFNKEQMEILTPHEKNFTTAVYGDYVTFTSVYNHKRVVEIYEQTTGIILSHNYNCKTCIVKNYKTVGELYFESKQYYDKQEENTPEESGEDRSNTKKRRGRKSKKSEQ